MILHCVFCQFQGEADPSARNTVLNDLREFAADLEGVESFEFGSNRDFRSKINWIH